MTPEKELLLKQFRQEAETKRLEEANTKRDSVTVLEGKKGNTKTVLEKFAAAFDTHGSGSDPKADQQQRRSSLVQRSSVAAVARKTSGNGTAKTAAAAPKVEPLERLAASFIGTRSGLMEAKFIWSTC